MRRVKVKVVPKSSRERVEESDGCIKIYLTAAPERGKANRRLIEVLADYLKVRKQQLRIVHGGHSRQKVVEIDEAG